MATRHDLFVALLQDVVMPNLDGFEAALAIRALEAASDGRAGSRRSDDDKQEPQRPAIRRRLSAELADSCPEAALGAGTAAGGDPQHGDEGATAVPRRIPIFAITCSTNDELWQRPVLHGRCSSPSSRAGATRRRPVRPGHRAVVRGNETAHGCM